MHISLIICTRNRAAPLQKCLEYVARLDNRHLMELVVVDNNSTDDTARVIHEFSSQADFPVKYVKELVPGLSSARNAGIRSSQGEIIGFTDDDCYVEGDYLDALLRLFDGTSIGYATGRVRLYDPTDYPVTINESLDPLVIPANSYVRPGLVKGANMAFRRSALAAIDCFDTKFGSGSFFPAEDCDAAARASLHGYVGVYAPELVVWHHHGRKEKDLEKLLTDYDIGRGAYHMKLLLTGRGLAPRLQGWIEFPKRIARRPRSGYLELRGAIKYVLVR
ncbi:glycosyltransferase family 2 protein [Flaviflagellibacter deserti]|uniref:Glycosyltransferase family 2 protein n=1 Tax=Flaviflagellibacter deserti TaxID=2267266 RepID=A0ABV9Z4D4_9HYPH